jgi:hypothetical protein
MLALPERHQMRPF